MCGILAVYSKKEKLNRDRCISALKTISWRGPDLSFHDFLEDDRLFMGQTVLSITGDILKGKGSCLKSNSGRYRILYNGEIYNYRELESAFLSSQPELLSKHKTDTEVLSNLHEVLTPSEIFSGLDGMFAYFVYDSKQKKVFIGRDVQGEKSLFVYEDDDILAVSSEIQAILAIIGNVSIDKQALRDYFRTRHFMLFDRTAYAGIRNLMPGRLESFDIGSFGWHQEERLDLGSWINPQIYMDNKERSIDSLADELDEILRTSVGEMIPRKRNYAVVVSGGVDSSLLAYYFIKQHEPKMLVAVNHVGKDLISCNLEGFEKTLKRKIETIPVDASRYAKQIDRCSQVCGGPVYSHSFVPQSIQAERVHQRDCRVLIGGEGGDELFGAYTIYKDCCKTNTVFSSSPYTALNNLDFAFNDDDSSGQVEYLKKIWSDSMNNYSFIDDPIERAYMAMMYCDTAYQLPAVGLRGADLMSMMWSVETRSIYVRRAIMQFALNLPAAYKVNIDTNSNPLLHTKPVLKQLFLRYFNKELLHEKQGFSGFPNESASLLGDIGSYLTPSFIGINDAQLSSIMKDRDNAWKVINIEHFLRNSQNKEELKLQSVVKKRGIGYDEKGLF